MIVYLDASALVKRYLIEAGTAELQRFSAGITLAGTSLLSRAEVSAAIARASRLGVIPSARALEALKSFRSQWPQFLRIRVEETTMAKADALAWERGLRGFDAVHLVSALAWRDSTGESPIFTTFDKDLWRAAREEELEVWPEKL